ncbi:MAG: right-handed parallel beta-helix repeat-containing protein [candidate division WOR-3 bacterium]
MVRLRLLTILFLIIAACLGPDEIAPRVRISFPQDGDTVASLVKVQAYATDNRGVALVQFFVDEALSGIDSTGNDSIFEWEWNLSGYQAGTVHRLQALAFDRAGNSDSSEVIAVVTMPLPGTYHQGRIAADETWTKDKDPHYVIGDLEVEATLTIAPGARVLIAPGVKITVGNFSSGAIRAEGGANAFIRFSPMVPESSWSGIKFLSKTDKTKCRFLNCLFENGGKDGATLMLNNAWIAVEGCSITTSAGSGVLCQGGGFTGFANNVITGCRGFPIVLDAEAAGTLGSGNRLRGNGFDFVQITGGTVGRSQTYHNHGIPYYVSATVTVAGDSLPKLTIAPECTLKFADSAKLRVGVGKPGALTADGTYGQIVFAGIGGGYWQGIEFWNNTIAEQTLLKNCLIDGAGRNGVAAILVYAPVKMEGTKVQNSASAGIYSLGTGFGQFDHNLITACARYPLHIQARHVGTIGQGNRFVFNQDNYILVSGDTVIQDASWGNHGVPYKITGIIEVGSQFAPSLYIGSGLKLLFSRNAGIRVGDKEPGRLIAQGIPDSIVFTGEVDSAGFWQGIDFGAFTRSGTILERCQILYAGGAGARGEVVVRQSAPKIIHNEIAYTPKYCIALFYSPLDPDTLRYYNFLHHYGEEDIYEEGP